ncbi:MAG: DUF1345 domain-containing protein [Chloroflexota bacterium]|nr:DUF1345 domain-containing protein [Chloroflexota bacterium]
MPVELDKDRCAWGITGHPESRWPASVAVVAAALLYVTLPERYTIGPAWLLPVLELALLVPLTVAVPTRHARETEAHRAASITLVAVVSAANVASLVLLVNSLLNGVQRAGSELFFAAMQIWLTNVIVFGLWYWELDRGGPSARCRPHHREPDFLFPQMSTPAAAPPNWAPRFLDYLYLAFTNATAFSPTDTLPLTAWSKTLMAIQSLTSLITVALVAGKAVNVL